MTLVLLLTAASGAWAADTYTITFSGFGNEACNKTVTDATLEYSETFNVTDVYANYINLGGVGGSNDYVSISKSPDDTKITITVKSAFEGTVNVTVYYQNENWDETQSDISVTCVKSAPTIEVTTNKAENDTVFTEAWFNMPAFDATAEYELVRDMAVDVTAEVTGRIRIAKVNNEYKPVNSSQLVPVVTDVLGNDSVKMKDVTDYIIVLQKKGENDEWVIPDGFSIGTFRYKLIGAGLYDGEAYSNEFELFEGFEVTVPAKEFATFYKNEPLYADAVTSADAELYTISSVTEGKAALSSAIETAPSNTPLLVYNNSDEEKTFLLIPASAEPNLALDVYEGFKGTLVAKTVSASDMADYDYYVCTGTAFVWVKDPGTIKANRCWLEMLKQQSVSVRAISIVFDDGEATGISDELRVKSEDSAIYTLDGRKVTRPAKNGVYIINGKKMVVK